MNILLISPPIEGIKNITDKQVPLGPLYLGAALLKNNHEVKFYDIYNEQVIKAKIGEKFELYNSLSSKLESELKEFKPDFIGISVHYSGRFPGAIKVSKFFKQIYQNCPIVLGGIHPTIFAGEILNDFPSVDYVIIGEGEKSFLKLINAHNNNSEVERLDGVAYRRNNRVIVNKKKEFIQDIDSILPPAYELVNLEDYYYDTSAWNNPKGLPINCQIQLITSRSCPFQCPYCSMFLVHGKKYRYRSPENVVDEIEYVYKKYNHRYFSFQDDNLTFSKGRTILIFEEILRRNLNIQFDTPNGLHINTLDKEALDLLVRAGLVKISLAIESGSDYIRNVVIGKNLKRDKIYEVFNLLKNYDNLLVNVFFVIGFPEETHKTLSETYSMIKKLQLKKATIHFAVPYPGTKLFEKCVENNLFVIPLDELHSKSLSDFEVPVIKPYNMEIQDLVNFRNNVYDELNMQKYILAF